MYPKQSGVVILVIKKTFYLILLALLCTSCAMKDQSGEIDLAKLYNKNEKYGVVICRGMFFDHQHTLTKFLENESSVKLMPYNSLYIDAKEISENTIQVGYMVGGSSSEQQELFGLLADSSPLVIKPYTIGFLSIEPAILKPEYFYTVKMLPQGEYYISSMV